MADLLETLRTTPAAVWAALCSALGAPLLWVLGARQRQAATAKDLAAAEESRAASDQSRAATEQSQLETNQALWKDVRSLQAEIQQVRNQHTIELTAVAAVHEQRVRTLVTLHGAEMDTLRTINAELERQATLWQAERSVWQVERTDILLRLAVCEQQHTALAAATVTVGAEVAETAPTA